MLLARPLFFFAFCGLGLSLQARADLPQPRAPRLLRLVEGDGKSLQGDCYAPQFAAKSMGVFFLRSDSNGARSLWFASPLLRPGERFPAWRAKPVLNSGGSLLLSEAAPLGDGQKVFLTIGAGVGQLPASQLARTEASKSPKVKPLWTGRERMAHLAPSPDGETVVFTRYLRDLRGRETPQLWRIESGGKQAKPVLVIKSARRAVWLDDSTLVFERLIDSGTAFYSLNPFSTETPRFLLRGSGEGACIGRGAGVIFAAQTAKAATTSLFLLARDGSGLRTVIGTEGARRPAVSPDGTQLAYDAPDPKSGARGLWLAGLAEPTRVPIELVALRAPRRKASQLAACPLEPMPLPPPASPAKPSNEPDEPPDTESFPVEQMEPEPIPTPTPTPVPAAPSANDDKADMDVAGTLANVAVNGKMRVTVWAKNRGKRTWKADTVRVVVRWIDFETGTRRRWDYKWIKGDVAPLGQFRLPMDVIAPNKPGRYKVIYSLIRLPSKGAPIKPPPYDSSQDSWPGEFAATAFAVNVN